MMRALEGEALQNIEKKFSLAAEFIKCQKRRKEALQPRLLHYIFQFAIITAAPTPHSKKSRNVAKKKASRTNQHYLHILL